MSSTMSSSVPERVSSQNAAASWADAKTDSITPLSSFYSYC